MTRHIVRRGETLTSIAKLYAVDIESLRRANNISDARTLQEGVFINVPAHRTRHGNGTPSRSPAKQQKNAAKEQPISGPTPEERGHSILPSWLEVLLNKLREIAADENVQAKHRAKESSKAGGTTPPREESKKAGSRGSRQASEVKQKLKETLNREPHVVTFNGVKLTPNERKQIIAAVACCEMSGDGFGSINSDQEFVGRKFGARGIETSYSRIVHIGLSYGVIQYTQDSGMLGLLLQAMYQRNPKKFSKILGGGDDAIAESLLELTKAGRADVQGDPRIPMSGQQHWQGIRNSQLGKELTKAASSDNDHNGKSDLPVDREIRGKRVQPIAPIKGGSPIDIWTGVWRERFLAAGHEEDFQDVQLEVAVKQYLDPILPFAKENKVRSAIGLAFIVACSVRGGPQSQLIKLLIKTAKEIDVATPFQNSDDELKCVKKIADSDGIIGSLKFDKEEARRAKLLLTDQLGFLAEDLYDLSTY